MTEQLIVQVSEQGWIYFSIATVFFSLILLIAIIFTVSFVLNEEDKSGRLAAATVSAISIAVVIILCLSIASTFYTQAKFPLLYATENDSMRQIVELDMKINTFNSLVDSIKEVIKK